jgi:hypothetical protein
MRQVPGDKPGAPVADPVLIALDQLRRAGADPTVPHQTRHFIYVPGVKAAQNLARALKSPRRVVELDTSARTGYWLVVIKQSMVVTPDGRWNSRAADLDLPAPGRPAVRAATRP